MTEIVQLQNHNRPSPEEPRMPQWLVCLEARNPVTMAENPAPTDARAMVEARISELTEWLKPADPKAVGVLLKRLSNHYPMPPMTEAEREMFWADYRADMGHLPVDLISEACHRWRRDPDKRFFPRPCELLELVSWKYDSRERKRRNLREWLGE